MGTSTPYGSVEYTNDEGALQSQLVAWVYRRLLICVAGLCAVTNTPATLAVAITAGFALFVGVKWVADRR